jgi:hypothetical protein
MGRAGGFYDVLDRVLRTLLVMAMGIIDVYGPPAGYLMLLVLVVFALFGGLWSRTAARDPTAAPVAS